MSAKQASSQDSNMAKKSENGPNIILGVVLVMLICCVPLLTLTACKNKGKWDDNSHIHFYHNRDMREKKKKKPDKSIKITIMQLIHKWLEIVLITLLVICVRFGDIQFKGGPSF